MNRTTLFLCLLLSPLCGLSQNLAPNASFESGLITPAAWSLSYPGGQLQSPGHTGSNAVSISGNGATMSAWLAAAPVTNGDVCAIRFWAKNNGASGGSSFGGLNVVYDDFALPGDVWTNYALIARVPDASAVQLNFGQVVINGSILLDDVELYRTLPVHKRAGPRLQLGEGEKLDANHYSFRSGFRRYAGSYARPLSSVNTSFAGFRWYMNPGSALVYHHELGGLLMTNAVLEGSIWNYFGLNNNTLLFEASTNGTQWVPAGAMTGGVTNLTVLFPTNLLPAADIYVRLTSTNEIQFSLTQYSFTADVPDNFVVVDGSTYFFEKRQAQPVLVPVAIRETFAGLVADVWLSNPGGAPDTFTLFAGAESGNARASWNLSTNIAPGQSNLLSIVLPSAGAGANELSLTVTNSAGSNVYNTSFRVPASEPGAAGNLAPNPSFEAGTSTPSFWDGQIQWANFGRTGSRSVAVPGNGSGAPGAFTWNCPTEPEQSYTIYYWTLASNLFGGTYLGGFNAAYREFSAPTTKWKRNRVVAVRPGVTNTPVILGGLQFTGTVWFDDVEVFRTLPVHKRVGAVFLGAGEKLEPGRYTFRTPSSSPQFSDYVGNYTRSFRSANTSFAGFRWYMNPGSYVLHRHELGGLPMTNATIKGSIWNYNSITNVALEVSVSTNGLDWLMAGQVTGGSNTFPAFEFNVPADLLPAPELQVLFRSRSAQQFSLMDYSLVVDVPANQETATGETCFLEQQSAVPEFKAVALVERPSGRMLTLALPNTSAAPQTFTIRSRAEFNGQVREWALNTNLPPNQTSLVDALMPAAGFGENRVTFTVTDGAGTTVFENGVGLWVSMLADDSYGERLPSPGDVPVWWCDGTYKIGRTRPVPLATNAAVHLSAARNEYEPFQLALRPNIPLTNVAVSITDFSLPGNGASIAASNVTMALVEYVPITELYNAAESSLGDTPDPLVPVTGPFNAPAFTNTTVWFTVKVPKDVPAGTYLATVNFVHASGVFSVPVQLHVRNFALSDTTHTAHVMNVIVDALWHKPANDSDRIAIWDLYMQNMARHRVTPYMAENFGPVLSVFNPATGTFTYNFTNYDAALSRYLDDFHFTSFEWLDEIRDNFSIAGVPRYSTDTNGNRIINPDFKTIYPVFTQPIAQHLRERGWLAQAYSYWIDEPALDSSPPTLALVKDGFELTGASVPGVKRLLPANTLDFPKPDLYGCVDIWVPAFDPYNFNPARNAERQAVGEKIWPYVFIRPFSPWPNNFTDQPAASPRLRAWIGERLNWDGELYWGINFYFNLPGIGARNPWTTPFVRDLGGTSYGNSDGALVYPPVKEYPTNTLIAGPIDSVRWEMIREGMEDREYFWLLKQRIGWAAARLGTNHPVVLAARAAQSNALAFATYPPSQPYQPGDIYASREVVAQAIEAIEDGSPFLARPPVSKAVQAGQSEYFQAEALGWPVPSLQWQHAGTNLPGATGTRLWLTNVTMSMAGDYRLLAVNTSGSTLSDAVKLTVYDASTPPQIIQPPVSIRTTNGGRVVFGVGVSSVTPCTYQWFFNGLPIAGATNLTLVLSNLNVANAGSYSVDVQNSAGSTVSASAALELPLAPVLQARLVLRGLRVTVSSLVSTGAVQFSTDLGAWQTLTNLPPSVGSISFVDPVTNAPQRFYRVLISP